MGLPDKPRPPAKNPCPKSTRGHSWGGRNAALGAGADPRARRCKYCDCTGRVDNQGVVIVDQTSQERTA